MLLLSEKGAEIENRYLIERLDAYGARVDGSVITFPPELTQAVLSESKSTMKPSARRVTAAAEIYQGWYLSLRGEYAPTAEKQLLEYKKLSMYLPGIDGISMLGCPITEVPPALQPLYEKLYCWKWGIGGGSALWESALLDRIYALWQVHAGYLGVPVESIFQGAVYMLSPLKLGHLEAEHLEYFARRGLRVHVGTMGSIGATAPVTRAGAMALQLAEQLFTTHLMRALWGQGKLRGGNALAVMDMRSMSFRYGRPEINALTLATGALAKHLGLPETYHTGLTDAKAPSFEAGVQKATSALMAAMTGGHGHIAAGLLSVDEVFSPVQMALDGELCEFLNRSLLEEEVTDESLALEVLLEVDHGQSFIDQEHTAMNMRSSLWQPNLFSRDMYVAWRDGGAKLDVDYAREKCLAILNDEPPLAPLISEAEERELQKILTVREA